MSTMRKTVSNGRLGRIKAWFFHKDHRRGRNPASRPTLECLERRDVPSATGLDPAQLQAGLNYLGQVVQQQTAVLQKDMSVLIGDIQHGKNARVGPDVQRLQQDFAAESQAILAAVNAVLSGHIPSSTPAATGHSSPTNAAATHAAPPSGKPSGAPSSGGTWNDQTGNGSPSDWVAWLLQNGGGSSSPYSGIASNNQYLWTASNQLNAQLAWGLGDIYSGELVAYSPIDDGSSALGGD